MFVFHPANGNKIPGSTSEKNMVYEFVTNFGVVNYEAESELISPQCRKDLKRLNEESKKLSPWALKMLDASGKPGSGLLNGNIHAMGSIHQCLNIGFDDPITKTKANTDAINATAAYCIATIYVEPTDQMLENENIKLLFDRAFSYHAVKSTYHKHEQGFMLSTSSISRAVCVPASCSHEDVFHLLEASWQDYNASGIVTRVRMDEKSCHTKPELDEMAYWTRFNTLTSIALLFAIVVIATLDDSGDQTTGHYKSVPRRFLHAFSLHRTWPELWSTSFLPGEITCLHGIRFIAIIIVYIQHKMIFRLFSMISNRTDMILAGSDKGSSPFRSMFVGVDIFVFLSGLLTAYYATQKLAKGGKLNLMQMYFSRYIKFTPTVMALSWFNRNLFSGLSGQYFRMGHFFPSACQDNWRFWLNLFHVQNTLTVAEICCPQTHSLATDMQHYLVAPFVVMLLWKLRNNKRQLAILSITSVLGLTLYKGYVVYRDNLATNTYFGLSVDDRRKVANMLNISPVHQFTTYLMGLLFGAFLQSGKPIILSRSQKVLGWLLFLASVHYCSFRLSHASLPGYKYDVLENTEFTVLRSLLWSGALSYLIYLCHTGQAQFINRLLSWHYFVIFSKLSYAIYLSSVLFIVYFIQKADYSVQFASKLEVIIDFNEILAILVSSAIATLILIMPLKEIAPLIMGVKKQSEDKKKKSTENGGRIEVGSHTETLAQKIK